MHQEPPNDRITIDVRLEERDSEELAVAREREKVRKDLLSEPRKISSKYFYDARGSELFERITDLPEYYQTRTERALLAEIAPELVKITQAAEIVELGSGASSKTRVLLDAFTDAGVLERYVPIDVSEAIVRRVAEELVEEYPKLEVHGVIADFLKHLEPDAHGAPANGGASLVLFLGGTLGNLRLEPNARHFLTEVAANMTTDDFFLLGTDLIKDVERLNEAYNDKQGVTAEFNRNMLRVLNREFEGNFEPALFAHKAFFNAELHRIEMWLVVTESHTVRLEALDLTLELKQGEEIRTEISTKFNRDTVEQLLDRSGFELVGWFTDPESLFALSLSRVKPPTG